jgi:hypothetical protein
MDGLVCSYRLCSSAVCAYERLLRCCRLEGLVGAADPSEGIRGPVSASFDIHGHGHSGASYGTTVSAHA